MPTLNYTDGRQDETLRLADVFEPMETTPSEAEELIRDLARIAVDLDEQIEERDKEIENLLENIKELEQHVVP